MSCTLSCSSSRQFLWLSRSALSRTAVIGYGASEWRSAASTAITMSPRLRRNLASTSAAPISRMNTSQVSLAHSFSRSFATSTPPPGSGAGSAASSAAAHSRATLDAARRLMEERRRQAYRERLERSRSYLMYAGACMILGLGVTYAAVPLYRAFCSATGFSGTPMTDPTRYTADRLYPDEASMARKRITVHFEATASDELKWKFTPQQRFVKVLPGETALAFYTAENWGKDDVIGIATYNTTPAKVAPYFAKVECFCFEQQKIRAGEIVDLPVFFFIDRDICDDPNLDDIDDVVLSYTFFKARRNKQGHLEPDASDDVVQKSMGWEGYEHATPTASGTEEQRQV